MTSHGQAETGVLKTKMEVQLSRLLLQLEDLEELRADLDDEEYEITRRETMEQMEEFEQTLTKLTSGNLSLVNELGSIRLAIQAAVSQAFKTPEVIKLFAKKEPQALRERLEQLTQAHKLGRLKSLEEYNARATEILIALKRLGTELSPEESEFLLRNMSKEMADFETVKADSSVSKGMSSLVQAANVGKSQKIN